MGVCLAEVSDHQQHHRERAPPSSYVLYHRGLATEQVKEQNRGDLHVEVCLCQFWDYGSLSLSCRYLKYCLDAEKISLVDVATVISTVAENVVGYKLAWNFIRQHWEHIEEG